MSNESKKTIKASKQASKTYVHIPRIASFKKAENKPGFLVPVNKRAHKLVRKLGKRTYVTAKQLAQFDGYHDIKVSHMRGGKRVLRSLSA